MLSKSFDISCKAFNLNTG